MLVLGLYVGGWWSGIVKVKKMGSFLWRFIEPLGRPFVPVKAAHQALMLGIIWGWLPCGLVYSALVWSLAAGSAVNGGLLMLGFGLGTLPALVALGGFAGTLKTQLQKPATRRLAGGLIVVLAGISLVWLGFNLSGTGQYVHTQTQHIH